MEKEGLEPLGNAILKYYEAAKTAKKNRMDMNRENFDTYNLNSDSSHKMEGQSREFLPKQQMAVEQLTSFLSQGLVDKSGWFDMDFRENFEPKILTAIEWKKIVEFYLDKIGFDAFMQDSFKVGLLGALMIAKTHGEMRTSVKYEVERASVNPFSKKKKLIRRKKEVWCPRIDLIRQEDYFPDPTGSGVFEIHAPEMDWYDLYRLAQSHPEDYDMAVVESLRNVDDGPADQKLKKARETNQNVVETEGRRRVRIIECWGTVYDRDGMPIMQNSVCAIASDGRIVRRATKIDFWDGESPITACPIIRVPFSVWHRALMDASTKTNLALNEIYNLMVDGGMMSVFGIKQIRSDWLVSPEEIEDGIPPGKTLDVNAKCPPNAKVMERVDTGAVSAETMGMFQLMDREHQNASMTSDIRMGNLPQRAVKATEVVASNQTATGMQTGFVKYVEKHYVEIAIKKTALNIAANLSRLDPDDLKAILGEQRSAQILAFSDEEVFAELANAGRVRVYGMTTVMNRINDYKKIATLLQTVGGSQDLMQEFRLNYSTAKLLGEILKSLDIDLEKIKIDPEERARAQEMIKAQMAQLQAKGEGPKKGMTQVGAPQNEQTQMDQFQGEMANGMHSGEAG